MYRSQRFINFIQYSPSYESQRTNMISQTHIFYLNHRNIEKKYCLKNIPWNKDKKVFIFPFWITKRGPLMAGFRDVKRWRLCNRKKIKLISMGKNILVQEEENLLVTEKENYIGWHQSGWFLLDWMGDVMFHCNIECLKGRFGCYFWSNQYKNNPICIWPILETKIPLKLWVGDGWHMN